MPTSFVAYISNIMNNSITSLAAPEFRQPRSSLCLHSNQLIEERADFIHLAVKFVTVNMGVDFSWWNSRIGVNELPALVTHKGPFCLVHFV
jgi:hypothetical protein